jgi:hypothetical protein
MTRAGGTWENRKLKAESYIFTTEDTESTEEEEIRRFTQICADDWERRGGRGHNVLRGFAASREEYLGLNRREQREQRED